MRSLGILSSSFYIVCACACASPAVVMGDELISEAVIAESAEQIAFNDNTTMQAIRCWSGVSDLPFSHELVVNLGLTMNEVGELTSVKLLKPLRRPVGSGAMATAVDRAMRAVRKCAPYEVPASTAPDQAHYAEVQIME